MASLAYKNCVFIFCATILFGSSMWKAHALEKTQDCVRVYASEIRGLAMGSGSATASGSEPLLVSQAFINFYF